jgi:hypothetical protein
VSQPCFSHRKTCEHPTHTLNRYLTPTVVLSVRRPRDGDTSVTDSGKAAMYLVSSSSVRSLCRLILCKRLCLLSRYR